MFVSHCFYCLAIFTPNGAAAEVVDEAAVGACREAAEAEALLVAPVLCHNRARRRRRGPRKATLAAECQVVVDRPPGQATSLVDVPALAAPAQEPDAPARAR